MDNKLLKRSEVPVEMTWRLEDIYEDTKAWDADRKEALRLADELESRAGYIAASAEELLGSLNVYEAISLKMARVYSYASMKQDEDTSDPHGQNLLRIAQYAYSGVNEKTAFLFPEIQKESQETIAAYMKEAPELERYRVTLREIFRSKPHTLSREMEEMIAATQEMADVPSNAYVMLTSADMKFPEVMDKDGNPNVLSGMRFVPLEFSDDRVLRKNAFEALYKRYAEFENTWAALYDGQIKQQIFRAKVRKYDSTLQAATEGINNVSQKVYENLINSVHEHLPVMHHYVRLRKKMLGVDELHMYDVYAPMVSNYEYKVSFEEAKAITLEALKPLGEEYLSIVKKAYAERWIDVYENEGKRGGAYSSDGINIHPYMLLNFHGTLDDVFTLIHEMGHSIHTWYSEHHQTFLDSRYSIFCAEVASETNEVLLLDYMLKNAKNAREKEYLLNHYLEFFKGSMIRQTMFAEFEKITNRMGEEGVPLTAEALCKVYLKLNKDYFGDDMISDPLIAYEWCRIPHFYYNFYVYQYATSFAAAVAIGHRIIDQGKPVVEKYLQFLSGGCTLDPVSLLRIAGVDLSKKEPIDEALEVFEKTICELENMADENK